MEVLLAYSNQADRRDAVAAVLTRLQELPEPAPSPVTESPGHRAPAQTHALSADQVRAIFAGYRAGAGPRELAGRYGVSERAIKYLVKKHGVQRGRGGGNRLGGRP